MDSLTARAIAQQGEPLHAKLVEESRTYNGLRHGYAVGAPVRHAKHTRFAPAGIPRSVWLHKSEDWTPRRDTDYRRTNILDVSIPHASCEGELE